MLRPYLGGATGAIQVSISEAMLHELSSYGAAKLAAET